MDILYSPCCWKAIDILTWYTAQSHKHVPISWEQKSVLSQSKLIIMLFHYFFHTFKHMLTIRLQLFTTYGYTTLQLTYRSERQISSTSLSRFIFCIFFCLTTACKHN